MNLLITADFFPLCTCSLYFTPIITFNDDNIIVLRNDIIIKSIWLLLFNTRNSTFFHYSNEAEEKSRRNFINKFFLGFDSHPRLPLILFEDKLRPGSEPQILLNNNKCLNPNGHFHLYFYEFVVASVIIVTSILQRRLSFLRSSVIVTAITLNPSYEAHLLLSYSTSYVAVCLLLA